MPNNRLGTHSVDTLRSLLTERDNAILHSIYEHKFLTTKHIYKLAFWNHASYVSGIRACTRVLNRLRDHHLIYRLERPVGGVRGGSSSYVWGIDAAGDRLLRSDPERASSKRARAFEPSTKFLAHTLAIAEIRIALEEAARAGSIGLIEVGTEPRNWRSFLTSSGSAQTLKPDLFAVTTNETYEDSWFIEVDRGNEWQPTLLAKSHYYQRYYESGVEQEHRGVFPLVVWLIPHHRQRELLLAAIAKDQKLNTALFRVISYDDFIPLVTGTLATSNKAAPQPPRKGGIQ